MEFLQIIGNASLAARLAMLISLFPFGAGLAYALKPNEQRFALMRPVSLAGLFSALSGTIIGFLNVLYGIWTSPGAVDWRIVAIGSAESLIPLLLVFACLTVGWLCIAAGLRRQF